MAEIKISYFFLHRRAKKKTREDSVENRQLTRLRRATTKQNVFSSKNRPRWVWLFFLFKSVVEQVYKSSWKTRWTTEHSCREQRLAKFLTHIDVEKEKKLNRLPQKNEEKSLREKEAKKFSMENIFFSFVFTENRSTDWNRCDAEK